MPIALNRTMACDFHKAPPDIALELEQYPQIVADRAGQPSFRALEVE